MLLFRCRSLPHAQPSISCKYFAEVHGGNRYLELPETPGYAAALDSPDTALQLTQLRNNCARPNTNQAVNNNPNTSNLISNEPIYRTIEGNENPYEAVSHSDVVYSCAAEDNSSSINSPYDFADDNTVNITGNDNDTTN